MTSWLNPYNYVKSAEQVPSIADGVIGEEGAQLFQSIVFAAMSNSELGAKVCSLFPMKEVVACSVDGSTFAVQFQKDRQAKITKVENTGEKQLEGAIFAIPRIIRGSFDPKTGKLEFADSAHAPNVSLLLCEKLVGWGSWSKRISASSPYMPLCSIQYLEKTDAFILGGISNLSMTVSREVFEATFKSYAFI